MNRICYLNHNGKFTDKRRLSAEFRIAIERIFQVELRSRAKEMWSAESSFDNWTLVAGLRRALARLPSACLDSITFTHLHTHTLTFPPKSHPLPCVFAAGVRQYIESAFRQLSGLYVSSVRNALCFCLHVVYADYTKTRAICMLLWSTGGVCYVDAQCIQEIGMC